MITLFGATGSGKSVQGELLARRHHWTWISSREILLNSADKELKYALEHGMFADDKKTTALMQGVFDRAHGSRKNVILDGFPSSYREVLWMIDHGEIKNLTGAIVLRVPRGELWKRLVQRKRVDDTRAAIERRWDFYDRQITGMIRTLTANGVLVREVNGCNEPKDVTDRIDEVLADWGLIAEKQYDKISQSTVSRMAANVTPMDGGAKSNSAKIDIASELLDALLSAAANS